MVARNIRSTHRKTTHYTETGNASKESSRREWSPGIPKLPYLGVRENSKQFLLKLVVSQTASPLITDAWKPKTSSNCSSAWVKRTRWGLQKQVDPFRYPANFALDFLTLFRKAIGTELSVVIGLSFQLTIMQWKESQFLSTHKFAS